ncbi:restriction endonuclease subunit S [Turicibacter sanguinis]|uniref:restriction endonuclease subunit S n=1 Tax=Turicibacter sanguinis TaxID=154288 RepID=UPI00241F0932|nr:restriction endonuclease subunit S [Turicibacter sanguinis]
MNMTPNLRFDGFNEIWEWQKGSSLFSILGGAAFSSRDASDEGIKWYKIANVGINKTDKKEVSYLPTTILEDYRRYVLNKGDITLALTRPILNSKLKICEIDDFFDGSLLNQRVGKLITKEGVDRKFIYYLLQTQGNIRYLENMIAGTDPPNLSNNDLLIKKYNVPNKSEQEKIASFFSLIDKKIELQTEKVEELKNYKKGIMQKIFSQELRFKDENGNEYPEWEERKLGNLINEYEYKTESNNKYPILSSTLNGIVLQSNYFSKQTASVDTTGYKIVPRGYFTYRSMSDTGVFRFNIQEVVDFGIVSPAYPVFSSSDKINSKFLELVLNHSSGVKRQLLITKEGGTRYALGFTKLKQIQVMIPCKLEQEKIAILIRILESKVNKEEQKLVALIDYKKGLLQQMFI